VIAGIDVSTKSIALVVLSSKTGDISRFDEFLIPDLRKLGGNKAERCRVIAETGFPAALKRVTVVYVEQPMGRQVKGVAEVERVVGSVIASVPKKTSVSLITPAEWKKAVGLKGNAQKDDIRAFADELYPVLSESSQDLHDAALIARSCFVEGGRVGVQEDC
jgi:Holliday junction resolvasome RuvABC endonuclease subunit